MIPTPICYVSVNQILSNTSFFSPAARQKMPHIGFIQFNQIVSLTVNSRKQ